MTSIYSITPAAGGVAVDPVWTQAKTGLAAGYTAVVPVQVGATTALFAYNKATQETDVYTLTGEAPWVQLAAGKPELSGPAWDSLGTFVLGNEPYLMTYEREHGTFGFFRVAADLSVGAPYSFVLPRNTPTRGFTTVAA